MIDTAVEFSGVTKRYTHFTLDGSISSFRRDASWALLGQTGQANRRLCAF